MIDSAIKLLNTKNKLVRFAIVGISATLTHSIIFLLLVNSLKPNPQFGNLMGFIAAVFVSYLGQRHWTFSNVKIDSELYSGMKFVVSSITSYLLNAFWVHMTVDWLALPPEYSVIGIIFITPVTIFILLKYWVFV